MRTTSRARARAAAVLLTCGLVLGGATSCGEDASPPASDALPTMPLGPDGMSIDAATATELIRDSYVVARGRFVGGPTPLTTPGAGEEFPSQAVVWQFVPDEVYRDVRVDDAPAKQAEEQRGSIMIAAAANLVGASRGDQPIGAFLNTSPSRYNLNTFPLDRPVYVFLHPGVAPREAVQRNPDLAHVMTLTGGTHCYLVDDLGRSCLAVADEPGGEPLALPEEGGLVPSGLTPEAIEDADAVTEVVGHGLEETDPWIDTTRFAVLPGGGGEG